MRHLERCAALALFLGIAATGVTRAGPGARIHAVPAPVVSAVALHPAGVPARAERARVLDCIDGDTIEVRLDGRREKIRMKGVDTPESVHPRIGAEPFGRQAARFTKDQLEGREVWVEVARGTRRDRYGRLLAFVWLADGTCHNETLIRRGLAEVYDRYDFDRLDRYRDLEREARRARRGIWQ